MEQQHDFEKLNILFRGSRLESFFGVRVVFLV